MRSEYRKILIVSYYRKVLMEDNQFVTRPIPRIDSDILKKSKAGRKKRFTPTTMKNSINKYFEPLS